MEVTYTNHIGRSSRDKHSGKDTAIHSINDLAAVERHNNHEYSADDVIRMQSAINLDLKHLNRQYEIVDGELTEISGRLDLEANVRKIYQEQFQDAVDQYNQKKVAAGHPERQIQSYIEKISGDKQQEVAVEGLIQFGSYADWERIEMADREKLVPLLLQSLQDTVAELKDTDREFVLAGASIHLNEGSPHLHYVGVPVLHTPDAKNGLSRRVNKGAVFSREALSEGLQDRVREKIAPQVKALYGWDFEKKKAGRNKDLEKNVLMNEKLTEQIQAKEQQLLHVQNSLLVAQSTLEQQVDDFVSAAVETGLLGIGPLEGAAYALAKCDEDQINELLLAGQEQLQPEIQNRLNAQHPADSLDAQISAILSGAIKPKQISWQQRQDYWEIYRGMADDFWEAKKLLSDTYRDVLDDIYDDMRLANYLYYNTLRFLRRHNGLLSLIITLVVVVVHEHQREKYLAQIETVRKKRSELIRDAKSFSKNSKAFREQLKAGKAPGQQYISAMSSLMSDLEHDVARLYPKLAQQHRDQKSLQPEGR